MLDTDQLRSFLAIVDLGSYTRAAERVNKTQSAVSMHIRRLEEQLACVLFSKHGRGMKLTREGEELIDYARRIVQAEAGALAALSRKGLRGSVRLGIPDDYAEAFLADILTRFNHQHPLVEVSATCENSIELAALTDAGAVDLALVTDYETLTGFELLREEPLAWCASPKLKIREGEPIPIAQGSVACIWRRACDEALGARKSLVRAVFTSKNFTAVGAVARAGLAATVLPVGMIGEGLRQLPADCGLPALPDTRMGLIFAPGAPSEETRALAQAVRDTIPPSVRLAA